MQKRFSGGIKEWLLLAAGAALLLAALLLPMKMALADPLTAEEQQLTEAWQQGELIRIHVIANSDSAFDQRVKYQVRDALIEAFGSLLITAGSDGSEAVFQLLQNKVDHMRQTAQASAKQNGFDGSVTAECGVLHLPSKQYGSVLLPEGDYRALRITLGSGQGQNWWCVLYPQLCLALSETDDAEPETVFWSSGRILRNWLLIQ